MTILVCASQQQLDTMRVIDLKINEFQVIEVPGSHAAYLYTRRATRSTTIPAAATIIPANAIIDTCSVLR